MMFDAIWITRDGQQIPISQLDTRHINNILRLMIRAPGWRVEYRERLRLELQIREMQQRRQP